MIAIAFFLCAVGVLAWPWLSQHLHAAELPKLDRRHVAAAILAAAGLVVFGSRDQAGPIPPPAPQPVGLSLRGRFVGPDAAVDAASTAALFDELAAEMEWDSAQAEPLLKTGVAFDELRLRARQLMMRGVSLGEKHPRARDAIKEYLDRTAGQNGGPLTPEQRARWIAAFRDVGRAAADATR